MAAKTTKCQGNAHSRCGSRLVTEALGRGLAHRAHSSDSQGWQAQASGTVSGEFHPENKHQTRHTSPRHITTRSMSATDQGDGSPPPTANGGDPPQFGSGEGGASSSSTTRNATAPLAASEMPQSQGPDDQAIVAPAPVSTTGASPVAGGLPPPTGPPPLWASGAR